MKPLVLCLATMCIVSGLCGVIGAVVDWDFYRNRYARAWKDQYGRGGTRIMVGFVGGVTLLAGMLGMIWVLGF